MNHISVCLPLYYCAWLMYYDSTRKMIIISHTLQNSPLQTFLMQRQPHTGIYQNHPRFRILRQKSTLESWDKNKLYRVRRINLSITSLHGRNVLSFKTFKKVFEKIFFILDLKWEQRNLLICIFCWFIIDSSMLFCIFIFTSYLVLKQWS